MLDGGDDCYHLLKTGDVRISRGSRYVSTFGIEKACPGKGIEQRSIGASGRYDSDGDSLIFHDSAGAVIGRGTMAGDTLKVTGPLHTLIYLKQ